MDKKSVLQEIRICLLVLVLIIVFWIAYNFNSPGDRENGYELRFNSFNSLFVVIDTFTFGQEEVLITLPTGNFRDSSFLKNPDLFFVFIDSPANLKEVAPGDIMSMDWQDFYSILSTYDLLLKKSINPRLVFHRKKLMLSCFIQKHREPNYIRAREMAKKLFPDKMISSLIKERNTGFNVFNPN